LEPLFGVSVPSDSVVYSDTLKVPGNSTNHPGPTVYEALDGMCVDSKFVGLFAQQSYLETISYKVIKATSIN